LNSEDGLLLACELKDKILHHFLEGSNPVVGGEQNINHLCHLKDMIWSLHNEVNQEAQHRPRMLSGSVNSTR